MSEFDINIFDPTKEQDIKDCKNSTPVPKDPTLAQLNKGDLVIVNAVSRVNKTPLKGIFFFDTWDAWDNSCYIMTEEPPKKPHMSSMSWNVKLTDLTKILYLSSSHFSKKARKENPEIEDISLAHIKAEWIDTKNNQKHKLEDYVGKTNVTIIYKEGKNEKVLQ